ncbi:MAG: DUF2179 domain-containing protein [Ferruginibacter sp.]|nr:DUF2179 domain-containing protein [Cytophagales bacterium]
MENFFYEQFGISSAAFNWVVLPLLIFCARISDVTLSTIRIVFVMSGRRNLAPILGFFESLIWLVAISQIMKNISSPVSYVAYAAGFASGTFVGMTIEQKLALGKVLVRVITRREATALLEFLRTSKYGYTNVEAQGKRENVSLIFSVVERQDLQDYIAIIERFNPTAFYTIENVRFVSDGGLGSIETSRNPLKELFRRMKRR